MGKKRSERQIVAVLEEIFRGVREDLATRQESVSLDQLKRRAETQPSAKNAVDVLSQDDAVTAIAEVKRSSHSKGAMAGVAAPARLAADEGDGHASAISELTEPRQSERP